MPSTQTTKVSLKRYVENKKHICEKVITAYWIFSDPPTVSHEVEEILILPAGDDMPVKCFDCKVQVGKSEEQAITTASTDSVMLSEF